MKKNLIQNIECGNVFFFSLREIADLLSESVYLYGWKSLFRLRKYYTIIQEEK